MNQFMQIHLVCCHYFTRPTDLPEALFGDDSSVLAFSLVLQIGLVSVRRVARGKTIRQLLMIGGNGGGISHAHP